MTRLYITSFPRLSHVCFISSLSYGTWGTDQNSIFCPIQILNDLLELKGLMFITWQINPKLFHWPSFGINMDTIVYVMAKSQEETCWVFHWLGNMNKIYLSYLSFSFFGSFCTSNILFEILFTHLCSPRQRKTPSPLARFQSSSGFRQYQASKHTDRIKLNFIGQLNKHSWKRQVIEQVRSSSLTGQHLIKRHGLNV